MYYYHLSMSSCQYRVYCNFYSLLFFLTYCSRLNIRKSLVILYPKYKILLKAAYIFFYQRTYQSISLRSTQAKPAIRDFAN